MGSPNPFFSGNNCRIKMPEAKCRNCFQILPVKFNSRQFAGTRRRKKNHRTSSSPAEPADMKPEPSNPPLQTVNSTSLPPHPPVQLSALATYGTGTVDGHAAFGVNWVGVGGTMILVTLTS
jgi:hypothetical protein